MRKLKKEEFNGKEDIPGLTRIITGITKKYRGKISRLILSDIEDDLVEFHDRIRFDVVEDGDVVIITHQDDERVFIVKNNNLTLRTIVKMYSDKFNMSRYEGFMTQDIKNIHDDKPVKIKKITGNLDNLREVFIQVDSMLKGRPISISLLHNTLHEFYDPNKYVIFINQLCKVDDNHLYGVDIISLKKGENIIVNVSFGNITTNLPKLYLKDLDIKEFMQVENGVVKVYDRIYREVKSK
jgi:hypothetical protein